MNTVLDNRFRQLLILTGVFLVGVLAMGDPALAHGKHGQDLDAVVMAVEGQHIAKDHEGHCDGGAFCSGPAIVFASEVAPQFDEQSARHDLPDATQALPVSSSFDPPPPRVLI